MAVDNDGGSMTAVETVKLVFISVPALLLLAVYMRNRRHPELAVRSPTLTFAANTTLVILTVLDALLNIGLDEYLTCAIYVIVISMIAQTMMLCWVVIAGTLYIAFNLAQQQLSLMDQTSDQSSKAKILNRISLYHSLLKAKSQVLFIAGGNAVTVVIEAIVVMLVYPETQHIPYSERASTAHYQALENLAGLLIGIPVLMLVWVSFNLRIVVDSLGIKSMLKSVGKSFVIVIVTYFAGLQIVPREIAQAGRSALYIFMTPSILIPSLVVPLYKALWKKKTDGEEFEGTGLEGFLRVPKYSNAFRKHLKSEYSVENLQFWLSADAFEHSFEPRLNITVDYTDMGEQAANIYMMFLREGAPQEVNLPSNLLSWFRDDVFVSLVTPGGVRSAYVSPDNMQDLEVRYDVFKEAKNSVFELLKADSFQRFLKNPEYASLWKEFQQMQMENMVMKTTINWEGAAAKTSDHLRKGSSKVIDSESDALLQNQTLLRVPK